MADRNLVTYAEENTSETHGQYLTGYEIKIDRSAAGQPGIFVTIKNALDEETTIVVKDGLALFAPVLEWLLTDELIIEVFNEAGPGVVRETKRQLEALARVARYRMDADTTDDGSPVDKAVDSFDKLRQKSEADRAPFYGGKDEDGI